MKMKYSLISFLLSMTMFMSTGSLIAQNSSDYKTSDFLDFDVKLPTEYQTSPENIQYLKDAISKQLEANGLKQSSNPDLAVNIGVVVEEETQTEKLTIGICNMWVSGIIAGKLRRW